MELKKIRIQNYRQFIDSTINFEDDITILAGANNSGKTSLIELLKTIFDSKKGSYCEDDIPITISKKWIDDVFVLILDIFKNSGEKNKNIEDIVKLISNNEDIHMEQKNIMKYTSADIEITYEEDENISKFADYLMDLDETMKSFFFRFEFNLNQNKLYKIIDEHYGQLLSRFNMIKKEDNVGDQTLIENKRIYIKEKLISIYVQSLEEKYYFTDKHYNNKIEMNCNTFKELFNFQYINANRILDDEMCDKRHSISKGMVNFISNDEEWENLIKDLPDKIIEPIENTGIKEKIRTKSLNGLSEAINAISKTNGKFNQEMALDMDIDAESIKTLLKNITSAKYKIDNFYLKETAQGLGYSNMIFLHLQLENYLKKKDMTVVNLFIIEEPEAHMHPQMQKVFIKYLLNYYKEKKIQGLVTTHSSEIVRATSMKKLRVIRQVRLFQNYIYDMNIFLNDITDREHEGFYNLLFNINFSDIVFLDKIIMYEGDTERMFLKNILKLDKFKTLEEQYIAFVQVGGAYAHKYKSIVEFLGIKTLITTDIDYEKTCSTENDVLKSKTTNAAIKAFYNEEMGEKVDLNIEDIYKWENEKALSDFDSIIKLKFQGEKDDYTRTLEEAMLTKYFGIKIEDKMTNKEWKIKKDENELIFVIPRKSGTYNVRDIVDSTSDSKTDFMYSVIMNKLVEKMMPHYIEEGLEWLMK